MKHKRWFRFLLSENQQADRLFLRCVCIVIAAILLWMGFVSVFPETAAKIYPGCPIHRWTGVYCPGCGGTRAFEALLHGQFLKSLRFHPLVVPAVLFTVVYLILLLLWKFGKGRTPKPHFRRIYLVIVIALILYHVIAANIRVDL